MSKSIEAITSTLLQPAVAQPAAVSEEADKSLPDGDQSSETQDDESLDASPSPDDGDEGAFDDRGEAEETEEDTEGEEAAEGEDDEPTLLDADDSDLVEVMIDGELKLLPLADLKRAAAGEGAIERRLQAATEARKEADTYRTKSKELISNQGAVLAGVMERIDKMLFEAPAPKVDESLMHTNPTQYLLQVRQAEAHKQRLSEGRAQLRSLAEEVSAKLAESNKQFRQEQTRELAKKLPILTDPKRGEARVSLVMRQAINHYGFSEEELALVSDHRFMHALHDAAMYTASQKGEAAKPDARKPPATNKSPKRVLRGSSNAVAKARAAQNKAKQANAVAETARKTGRLEDVAATLLVPQKPRANRR